MIPANHFPNSPTISAEDRGEVSPEYLAGQRRRAELLNTALAMREMGRSVIPLDDQKRPLGWWSHYQRRRPSEKEIVKLFGRGGLSGIGLVCGRVSGRDSCSHVVRDFDTIDEYERWRGRNRRLAADAPTVVTRRGRHVHVRVPGYVKTRVLTNGELISEAKYVVLPPSLVRPKRNPEHLYRWEARPAWDVDDFPLVRLADTGFLTVDAETGTQARKRWRKTEGEKAEKAAEAAGKQAEEEETSYVPPLPTNLPLAIREAILRTRPSAPGQRHRLLHQFARNLRDVLPANAPESVLEDAVSHWWGMAKEVIDTNDFATNRREFFQAWELVHVPISASVPIVTMTTAAAKAHEAGCDRRSVLLAACRAMAAKRPDGVFALSARTAERVTGIPYRSAARLLRSLVEGGSLVLVEQGMPSPTKRCPSRFKMGATP